MSLTSGFQCNSWQRSFWRNDHCLWSMLKFPLLQTACFSVSTRISHLCSRHIFLSVEERKKEQFHHLCLVWHGTACRERMSQPNLGSFFEFRILITTTILPQKAASKQDTKIDSLIFQFLFSEKWFLFSPGRKTLSCISLCWWLQHCGLITLTLLTLPLKCKYGVLQHLMKGNQWKSILQILMHFRYSSSHSLINLVSHNAGTFHSQPQQLKGTCHLAFLFSRALLLARSDCDVIRLSVRGNTPPPKNVFYPTFIL